MKLIVLDDKLKNPLRFISDFLQEFQEFNVTVCFLYYQSGVSETDNYPEIYKLYESINVEIKNINMLNFFDIMEPLYINNENIFLYDYELEGDNVPDIYRIQIGYALNKIGNEQNPENRFFFYSSKANSEQLSNLKGFFPDHVMDTQREKYEKYDSVKINFHENSKFNNAIKGVKTIHGNSIYFLSERRTESSTSGLREALKRKRFLLKRPYLA